MRLRQIAQLERHVRAAMSDRLQRRETPLLELVPRQQVIAQARPRRMLALEAMACLSDEPFGDATDLVVDLRARRLDQLRQARVQRSRLAGERRQPALDLAPQVVERA